MSGNNVTFFLGANTPKGFINEFSELYSPFEDWGVYILKGGPGTGKSGAIKRIIKEAENLGLFCEKIICSSDPDSFDAVIIPEIKFTVADGTPPHVIEPKFPGVCEEIVNFGDCRNREMLRLKSGEIKETTLAVSQFHMRCVRFLSAAASLRSDTKRILRNCADRTKIENYSARFSAREFGPPSGRIGTEAKRFLSAPTPKGVFTLFDTVSALASKVIVIDDPHSAAAPLLLENLRRRALSLGLNVISCLDPFSEDCETAHLIIPEKDIALFTSSLLWESRFEPYRRISAKRFLKEEEAARFKGRIAFNARAAAELTDEAVLLLQGAKTAHDRLESFYTPAMDFEKVERKTETIIRDMRMKKAIL